MTMIIEAKYINCSFIGPMDQMKTSNYRMNIQKKKMFCFQK